MNTKTPETGSPSSTPRTHGEDIDHAGHVDTGIMSRRWIYLGSLVLLVAILVTGLIAFRDVHRNNEANRKADQLRSALAAAGLPQPDKDLIVRSLGTDGGPVCENPGDALRNGVDRVGLGNGAAGPGQRPVIGSSRIAAAERIVLQTYCPGKVAEFDDEIDDLKFDDVLEP
ncbi:MAG: hypothetical protein HOV96_08845 [Nonomuraea sp.]|nr:hypothetical protein [Nonomuraea sp.]